MATVFLAPSPDFVPLTRDRYQANLYPSSGPVSNDREPTLGICLSGGGSRALSCALGQLSGLRSLRDPQNPSQTVLDRVKNLSSVSGGSWASVLYTFLPQKVGGNPVSDDDFLISPQPPGALVKDQPSVANPQNVAYLAPFCLGNIPGQFTPHNIGNLLVQLYDWGMFSFSSPEKRRWWWIAAVGELVLKPFDLYDGQLDSNFDYLQPKRFFSLSKDYIDKNIHPKNKSLDPSQFYTTRPKRPALFVNTNLLQNFRATSSPQIPVQATPIDTGIVGQSPDRTIVGGGSVESFAFTSTLDGKGDGLGLAAVTAERRYSLCDIAGCSSAFFAELLLKYINKKIFPDIAAEIRKILKRHHVNKYVIEFIINFIRTTFESIIDKDASDVIPQYNYWSLGEVGKNRPPNASYGFSDGGNFDNTGILGLLARTGTNRIISFVNDETPISRDQQSNEILVAEQLPLLFGYQASPVNGHYVSFGGMSPNKPMSYVQVFSDANGEFAQLRQGLFDASTGGSGSDSDLGTDTAAFLQTLTTVDNPVANIKAGRQIKVLWVYNNRVNKWQNAIQATNICNDLKQGQTGKRIGPLAHFPHYDTGLQIYLDAEGVNMLAQLSAWNVQQLQSQITQLLS